MRFSILNITKAEEKETQGLPTVGISSKTNLKNTNYTRAIILGNDTNFTEKPIEKPLPKLEFKVDPIKTISYMSFFISIMISILILIYLIYNVLALRKNNTENAKKIITNLKLEGYSDEEIKNLLLDKSWPKELIEDSIKE
ncbi:MAG: hypothetical protein Q8N99_03165 [Nanoarchaeota archaeon]|nr:hypothetical protein [Nanoarchaeota archaeon]